MEATRTAAALCKLIALDLLDEAFWPDGRLHTWSSIHALRGRNLHACR